MPRKNRLDLLDRQFHVTNRGIARRTVFETAKDVRYFLACVAREVRAGRIRVLAYAILTTHFHLLVQSCGDMAEAIRRITNRYVRYFNRTRKRDGPLFRGRYFSKWVDSAAYRWTLMRYIDQNAVQARLAGSSGAYAWGSARHYGAARRPPWLDTEWVDRVMEDAIEQGASRMEAYTQNFGTLLERSEAHWVETLIRSVAEPDSPDGAGDLLSGVADRVLQWMERKCRLADATRPGATIADPAIVRRVVELHRDRAPSAGSARGPGRIFRWWDSLEAGLLRDVSGLSVTSLRGTLGISPAAAARRCAAYSKGVKTSTTYRTFAHQLLRQILDRARPAYPTSVLRA